MQNPSGIDVSKEEEQFLRRAFRRFALPYVLVVAAVAWIATTVAATDAPSGSSPAMSSLLDKVDGLEKSVAALEARIAKVDGELARAGSRVGALESRRPAAVTGSADTAELERRCAMPRAASQSSSGATPPAPAPPSGSMRSPRACTGS